MTDGHPIMLHERDCMEAMKEMKDNAYELAICDPMYDLPDNYLVPGTEKSITYVKRNFIRQAKKLASQKVVDISYFKEVQRTSKNQIIWGENYFQYPNKPIGRIIWDKVNDSSSFSNAEIASCSMIKGVRTFRFMWNGMIQQDMKNKERRIHPFQKPVALYKWLLGKYAKPGDKILDTHLGSGSSAIAAYDMGFSFTGYEIEHDYLEAAKDRIERHMAQGRLFKPEAML